MWVAFSVGGFKLSLYTLSVDVDEGVCFLRVTFHKLEYGLDIASGSGLVTSYAARFSR